MNAKLLVNMFNVDLFGLVWIAVAVVVLGLLVAHFYHGLEEGIGDHGPREKAPSNTQIHWLTGALAIWWGLDTLWHARAFVVTPRFWRPEVHAAIQNGLPWIHWTTTCWAANPILWDFATLAVDGTLTFILVMSFRRPTAVTLLSTAVWGVVRWMLAGADASWVGGTHLIGPGGYFMAAALGYLIWRPRDYPAVLAGLAVWLAVDSLIFWHHTPLMLRVTLSVGFGSLALASGRRWAPATRRLLAASLVTVMITLGIGAHVLTLGLNLLWAPILFVLTVGRDLVPNKRSMPEGD